MSRRRTGPGGPARAKLRRAARIGTRAALFITVACCMSLIGVQITRVLAKNVTLSRELAASRSQIDALRERERVERATIGRLSEPRGAIPEIHDKLHLVSRGEEIIYVRGLAPQPGPGDWRPQP